MSSITLLIFVICLLSKCSAKSDLICVESENCEKLHHVIVKLETRNDEFAKSLAEEHGMVVKGKPFMDSHYFLYHIDENIPIRRKRAVYEQLQSHPAVASIFEQTPNKRSKRDYQENAAPNGTTRTKPPHARFSNTSSVQVPHLLFKDPLYMNQWYLNGHATDGLDMNVRPAWKMGYAGRNVSVSILDDGIQRDHPDLAANYDPLASTDINDHDDDPTPQDNGSNKHGTRCAGDVAAVANNDFCGVGIAFKAKIGGVRILDGPVSDSVEAAALSFNQDHIDIYSASWGPEDDGKSFDGPGPLASEAFYRGIKGGRHGKGNIYVWASGNGGANFDSCAADGFASSIYTLSISSATFENRSPWYLEECPSTIATTYSSANTDQNEYKVTTTDVPNGCTTSHTGTSASAPMAAGIIALALEANPSLTWRDVQHLVIRSSNPNPLLKNPGWSKNGAGRMVSSKFGFGLMDGEALVRAAKLWKTVPEQHICTYNYRIPEPNPRPVSGLFKHNFTLEVKGCNDGAEVLYLEHVQVLATVKYSSRGALKITVISPAGTTATILPPRAVDNSTKGFYKWPFMSVHQWGEDPRGNWTLTIESVSRNFSDFGTIHDWSLVLYGTETPAQPGDPLHFHESLQSVQSQVHILTTAKNATGLIPFRDNSSDFCHDQCLGGCSEPQSAISCYTCKTLSQPLKNKAGQGFKCVSRCEHDYYQDGMSCRRCSRQCRTCISEKICKSCWGFQLLIDLQHEDLHGKCVANCPKGTVPDYLTNVVQARCILPKEKCGSAFYINEGGKCAQCDTSCEGCHGPGPRNCDKCINGYGNQTAGLCLPCCIESKKHGGTDCDQCTHFTSSSTSSATERNIVIPENIMHLIVAGCFFIIALIVIKLDCKKIRRELQKKGSPDKSDAESLLAEEESGSE